MHIEIFMVIGYVLMSSAVGLFSAGAITQLAQHRHRQAHHFVRFSFILAFPLMVLGAICTLLHLGNPSYFYGILTSPSSWLMRESWFVGIFMLITFIAFIIALRRKAFSSKPKTVIALLGLCFGLLLLFSMSMAYMQVSAIPVWNNLGVLITNLAEVAVLGSSIACVYLAFKNKKDDTKIRRAFLIAGTASSAFALLAFVAYKFSLDTLPAGAVVTGSEISTLIVVKIVLLILALLIYLYSAASQVKLGGSMLVVLMLCAFVAVISSDVISRVLHFMMATHLPLYF